MPEIALPYVAPFGIPIFTTIRGARDAGFHGVEICLIGLCRSHEVVRRRAAHARRLGLSVTLHQGWSIEEGNRHPWNRVLHLTGQLPRRGYTLAAHVPAMPYPAVVYADRFGEAMRRPNLWLQTYCHRNGQGDLLLSFGSFLAAVKRWSFGVVFDTQHYLEYVHNAHGVEELPIDPHLLLRNLRSGWRILAPYVREIHLCDADPRRGHSWGCNVFPGTGILPLREFCKIVKESGWDGRVVPEVNPRYLRGRAHAKLFRIVRELFS